MRSEHHTLAVVDETRAAFCAAGGQFKAGRHHPFIVAGKNGKMLRTTRWNRFLSYGRGSGNP